MRFLNTVGPVNPAFHKLASYRYDRIVEKHEGPWD